jgi:hypothetical protein
MPEKKRSAKTPEKLSEPPSAVVNVNYTIDIFNIFTLPGKSRPGLTRQRAGEE